MSKEEIIIEVVSHYVDLKPSGSEYKACCPFHSEKTPSFTVNPQKGLAWCFGCGAGGDVFEFVKQIEECSFPEALNKVIEITGLTKEEIMKEQEDKEQIKKEKPTPITKEQLEEFRKDKTYKSNNYRGIKDEYHKFFGHLSKVDEQGNVVAQYFPETYDGKLVGYKSKHNPKKYGIDNLGVTGSGNELSGQVKFKNAIGKYVLVVAGEEDKVAAYQMLRESQLERNQEDFNAIPVVSPTSGENSAAKQCAAQYEWFDKFDNILIGLDADDTGFKCAKEVAEVLPKHKVKMITWSKKDPNLMLQEGLQKQFLRDFYGAKDYVPSGVKTSIEADTEIELELSRPKVTLPPFAEDLQKMMAGGIPLGYIVNLISLTGSGKTTIVNEFIRHWIYNSPYKIGILSLELTAAQYMIAMLSREVGNKILLIETPKEALDFVNRPDVKAARQRLCENQYGEERFVLLDDREGTLESVMSQCELLVNKYGCKFLVIDPLQDLFEGCEQDAQLKFLKWMKIMVKKGVTFIDVCHVRKSANSTTKDGKRIMRELTEEDVHGISAITKSGGANIFIQRDKYAEDPIERNTSIITAGKIRWTGLTGPAGEWYYDNPTHTVWNKKEWLKTQVPPEPEQLQEGGVFESFKDYDAEMQYFESGG